MSYDNEKFFRTEGGTQQIFDYTPAVAQIIYLDFDGAVTDYQGEILTVEGVVVEDSGLSQENIARIVSALNEKYASQNVVFTTDLSSLAEGEKYSTIYIGKTSSFEPYGKFAGLAETVDSGNRIKNDNAFVILDSASDNAQIIKTVSHETDHLLGTLDHGGEGLEKYAQDYGTVEIASGESKYYTSANITSALVQNGGKMGVGYSTTISKAIIQNGGSLTFQGSDCIVSSMTVQDGGYVDYFGNYYYKTNHIYSLRLNAKGYFQYVRLNKTFSGICIDNGIGDFGENLSFASGVYSVKSGGSFSSAIIVSKGSMVIQNGGSAGDFVVSGGILNIHGVADNTTIYAGSASVELFGKMRDTTLSGGVLAVAGLASGVTVAGGSVNVLSSGFLSSASVNAKGELRISQGGSASGVTMDEGASLYLEIGQYTQVDLTSDGSAIKVSNGILSGVAFSKGLVEMHAGGTLENTSFGGNAVLNVSSNTLVQSNIFSGSSMLVNTGASVSSTTLAGGSMVISGSGYDTLISGGTMNVSQGGYAENTVVSGGSLRVSLCFADDYRTSAKLSGTVVDGGHTYIAATNGFASLEDTVLRNGVLETLYSNVTVSGLTISGGSYSARNHYIYDLNVSGGSAVINSGIVFNGNFAGGQTTFTSGAVVSNTITERGAIISFENGTAQQGLLVVNKGTEISFKDGSKLYFDLNKVAAGSQDPIVSNYSLIKEKKAVNIIVADTDNTEGYYVLATGVSSSDKENIVFSVSGETLTYDTPCEVNDLRYILNWNAEELTLNVVNMENPPTLSVMASPAPDTPAKEVCITVVSNAQLIEYNTVSKEFAGEWVTYTVPFTTTENATYYFRATGYNDLRSYADITLNKIDNIPPVLTVKLDDDGIVKKGKISFEVEKESGDEDCKPSIFYKFQGASDWIKGEISDLKYDQENSVWSGSITVDQTGDYVLKAVDAAGNESLNEVTVDNVDLTPPETPVAAADIRERTNLPVTITVTYLEEKGDKLYRIGSEGEWLPYNGPFSAIENGDFYFKQIDEAKNESEISSLTIDYIDRTGPVITIDADTATPCRSTSFSASAEEPCCNFQISYDNENWETYDGGEIKVTEHGSTYYFRAFDDLNNKSEKSITFNNVVSEGPEITLSVNTTNPARSVFLTASTAENVPIEYSLDESEDKTWTAYTGVISVTENATYYFRAYDRFKNEGTNQITITNIDIVPPEDPVITLSTEEETEEPVIVKADFAGDSADQEYSFNASDWKDYSSPVTVTSNCTIYFRSTDLAGNASIASREISNIITSSGGSTGTSKWIDKIISSGQTSSFVRGKASNTTIQNGGVLSAGSSSVMSVTNIESGGSMTISNATAASTFVDGSLDALNRASLTSTVIRNGGRFSLSGGVASRTTVSGGSFAAAGGTAVINQVSSAGSMIVSDGIVSRSIISSGGFLQTEGGSTLDTTILTGGTAHIKNGIVSAMKVSSGAYLDAGASADIANMMLLSGAAFGSFSFGSDYSNVNVSGGTAYVGPAVIFNSSGASKEVVVPTLFVSSGAVVAPVSVASGAQVSIAEGGRILGGMISGGALMENAGIAENVSAGGSFTLAPTGSAVDLSVIAGGHAVISGGTISNASVTGTMTVSNVSLATGITVASGGSLDVAAGIFGETTVCSGASAVFSSGTFYHTAVSESGVLALSRVSANVLEIDGGTVTLNSAGIIVSAAINAGDFSIASDSLIRQLRMNGGQVNLNGLLQKGSIASSATLLVSGGAISLDQTGGFVRVADSGTLYSIAVSSGAVLQIDNGGKLGGVISSGSSVLIYSGVIASGGSLNLLGSAENTVLENGSAVISSGGTMTDTLVSGGGLSVFGTLSNTIFYSGSARVRAGGIINDFSLSGGASVIVSSGGTLAGNALIDQESELILKDSASVVFTPGKGINDWGRVSKEEKTLSYSLILSGTESIGSYALIGNISNFDSSITVYMQDSKLGDLSVKDTATVLEYEGYEYSLKITGNELSFTVASIPRIVLTASETVTPVQSAVLKAETNVDGAAIYYTINNGEDKWTLYDKEISVTKNGLYSFKTYAGEEDGWIKNDISFTNIDREAPVITLSQNTKKPASSVIITVSANEPLSSVEYKFTQDGTWTSCGEELTVTENGKYYFRAADIAGNTTTKEYSVEITNIDKEEIVITVSPSTTKPAQKVFLTVETNKETTISYRDPETAQWVVYTEPIAAVVNNVTYSFKAEDSIGNIKTAEYTVSNIDTEAPDITLTGDTENKVSTTYLTAEINEKGAIYYSFNGEEEKIYKGTITVDQSGTYVFRAVDEAGNESTETIRFDNVYHAVPALTFTISETGKTQNNVYLTAEVVPAEEEPEGIEYSISYTLDSSKTFWIEYKERIEVEENGIYYFRVRDNYGNTKDYLYTVSNIDRTPPKYAPSVKVTPDGWTNGESISVSASLISEGDTGKYYLDFRLGEGEWHDYEDPVILYKNGEKVQFRSRDEAGNTTESEWIIAEKFDRLAPVVSISAIKNNEEYADIKTNIRAQKIALYVTAADFASEEDNISGVKTLEYSIDGQTWVEKQGDPEEALVITIETAGEHEYSFRATDNAGNISEVISISFTIDKEPPEIKFINCVDGTKENPIETGVLNIAASDNVTSAEEFLEKGLIEYSIRKDGDEVWSDWFTYTGPVSVQENAVYQIRAKDEAGNEFVPTEEKPNEYTFSYITPKGYVTLYKAAVSVSSAAMMIGKTLNASSYTSMVISSGGIADQTDVLSGGSMQVFADGSALVTTLDGGSMAVSGFASSTTISGGTMTLSSGASAAGIDMSGGFLEVASGGIVNDLKLSGGTATVNGGSLRNLTAAGGSLSVASGGISDFTVSGGSVTLTDASLQTGSIAADGKITLDGTMDYLYPGEIVIGGNLTLEAKTLAVQKDVTITLDLTQRAPTVEDEAFLTGYDNLMYVSNITWQIKSAESFAEGEYLLMTDAAKFSGTITVKSGEESDDDDGEGLSLSHCVKVAGYEYMLSLNEKNQLLLTVKADEAPGIDSISYSDKPTNQSVTVTADISDNLKLARYEWFSWDNDSLAWKSLLGEPEKVTRTSAAVSVTLEDNATLKLKVTDAVGNVTESEEIVISNVDREAPGIGNISYSDKPTNQSVTVTAYISDNLELKSYEWFSWDNDSLKWKSLLGEPEKVTGTSAAVSVTLEDNATLKLKVTDAAGNESESEEIEISNIDREVPVITVNAEPAEVARSVEIRATATKGLTDSIYYNIESPYAKEWTRLPTVTVVDESGQESTVAVFTAEFNATFYFKVTDAAGNVGTNEITIENVDREGPEITLTLSTEAPAQKVIIYAEASADANELKYQLPGSSDWLDYNDGVTATENGTYNFSSKDKLGNMTEKSITVTNVDTVKPVITLASSTEERTSSLVLTASANKESVLCYNTVGAGYEGEWTEYISSITVLANATYYFKATDEAGNVGTNEITISNVDHEPPTITLEAETDKPVQYTVLTASAADEQYKEDCRLSYNTSSEKYTGDWIPYTEPILVVENTSYFFRATDDVGNVGTNSISFTNIDNVPPVITLTPSATDPARSITLTASTDDQSDLYYNTVDAGYEGEWLKYDSPLTVEANAVYYFKATDEAGNVGTKSIEITNIKRDNPSLVITVNGEVYDPAAQEKAASSAKLAVSTDEGLDIYQSINGSSWSLYTEPLTVTTNSTYSFKVTDAAGNMSQQNVTFTKIDTVPPEAPNVYASTMEPTTDPVTVTAVYSGDSETRQYSYDSRNWFAYPDEGIVCDINCTLYFRGIDEAGNISYTTPYIVSNITQGGEKTGTVLLPNDVPEAEYMYGCTATAVGMLLGYYDSNGYLGYSMSNLFDGYISLKSRGTDGDKYNMNAFDTVLGNAIATKKYVSLFYNKTAAQEKPYTFVGDTYILNTVNYDCIAAWLGTGMYGRGGEDLSTSYYEGSLKDVAPDSETAAIDFKYGLNLYVKTRGYALDEELTRTVKVNTNGGSFTFSDYKAEIDAGRPVIINITSTASSIGHSMIGYGYDTNTNEIIFDDCYEHDQRMKWNGTYQYDGNTYSLDAISTIVFTIPETHPGGDDPVPVIPDPVYNPEDPVVTASETAFTNQSVVLTAAFDPASDLNEYSVDNVNWSACNGSVTAEENGTYYFRSSNSAGVSYASYTVGNIDKVAPSIPLLDSTLNNGVYTVSAVYASDSVKNEYSLDGITWNNYSSPLQIRSPETIIFRSTDAAGNTTDYSYTAKAESAVERTASADLASGTKRVSSTPVQLAVGKYSVTADLGALNGTIKVINSKNKAVASAKVRNGVYSLPDFYSDGGTFCVQINSSKPIENPASISLNFSGIEFSEADTTDNSIYDNPGTISIGGKDSSWVGFGDELDLRKIDLAWSGSYDFAVSSIMNNTQLTVYQVKNGRLAKVKSVKANAAAGGGMISGVLLDRANTYYLEVKAPGAKKYQNTSYDVSMSGSEFTRANNADDFAATAAPWDGSRVDDWVGYGDAIDYRRIDISSSGCYSFDISGISNAVKMTVYEISSNGTIVRKIKSVKASASSPAAEISGVMLSNTGKYVIAVEAAAAKKAQNSDYTLEMRTEQIFNTNNNTFASATDLSGQNSVSGGITKTAGGDSLDYLDIESWNMLQITADSGSLKLSFYDENGRALAMNGVIDGSGACKSAVSTISMNASRSDLSQMIVSSLADVKYMKIEAGAKGLCCYTLTKKA